ncbi:hypothetical protein Afil01_02230 [Actinorhabdospora filicis]|uniref:Uncharacterized protein n=1 Tax=Actinorhabdospora filicis TaxID=1785913 RepID=A0A9W6SIR9_9ACTN|nr:hypothetical protein [Actinorhabdospora filicis]GLZ75416.1 hypothetical protein Afil01_02230 [Actinorhabdospora filicis]
MHTTSEVIAEIANTKNALYKCWAFLTSTYNGQAHAAPSWAMGHWIETEYGKIDVAFGWVMDIPEAAVYDDFHGRAVKASDFVKTTTYGSPASSIADKVGNWTGTAATNFHTVFIKSMEGSVANQRELLAAVANAYGGVQSLCHMAYDAAINVAKEGQKAYQNANEGKGGGGSNDGVKMFANVVNVVTGVAAAAAGAATGGATLALYLGSASAISGFVANVISDGDAKMPEIHGSDPIEVTDSFVQAMIKASEKHQKSVKDWETKTQEDLAKVTKSPETMLLPIRPKIAPG